MSFYFSRPATRSFQWSNISAHLKDVFPSFGGVFVSYSSHSKYCFDKIPLAILSRTVVRNQGEYAFPDLFLAATRIFFLFCLKEGLFKSLFLKGITTYEDCNNFKVSKTLGDSNMFQKETFSVKGENFGINSRSVSVCFPATFTALSCVFLLGKNFLVWNLIKFKKQKYH